MKKQITLLIAVCIAIFTTTNSFAQVVTSGADDGSDGTLRQEIADTPAGETITFMGVSNITLTMGELLINKSLTITGSVTVSGNNASRVFNITAGTVELNGLTITNGLAYDGGGIYLANATLTINDCIITNNVANGTGLPAGSGGGIFNAAGGVLMVNDSEISSNTANRAGGGIEDNSGAGLAITLNNVNLDNNNAGVSPATAAPGNGGGLHVSGAGDAVYNGGSVTNNMANEGGGLWNGAGMMTVTGVTFTGNAAFSDATGGGALFNNGGILSIDNASLLTENMASGAATGGRGGAIFNNADGTLTLAPGLNILGNYASRAGGAIEDASNGMLMLDGVVLADNSAGVDIGLDNFVTANPGNGGALHLSGTTNATIEGSIINGNFAAQEGGGLWNNAGTMIIRSGSIDNNEAYGDASDDGGGAIFNNGGTLSLQSGALVTNNSALGVLGSGGGVFSIAGNVTIMQGTIIRGNTATRAGGGIEIVEGDLVMTNSFLNTNSANSTRSVPNPGSGGGLHITGAANSSISGGTTNNNVAANEGGGLWNGSGTMTIIDHTVDGNIALGNDAMVAGAAGGGGIYNEGGTLDLSGSTEITNNVADGAQSTGGGILNAAGTLMANGITIMDNTSNRAGGGIETNGGGVVTLTDVSLNSNDTGVVTGAGAPGNGGGLHVSGNSAVTITGGMTNLNTAANEGGGLWNGSGLMTVVDHTVDGNTASGNDTMFAGAAGGGGIYNEGGTLDLSGSTEITNNVADGAQSTGGGILNAAGTLMANGITIMDNTSNRAGGGIETNGGGAVTLTDVSLNSNDTGVVTGTGAPGNGGGLHVSGSSIINLIGGTVNMNTAASEGGGLWNGTGTLTVDATTIDGNIASGAGADNGGGGIYALNGGTVNLVNGATVSNNIADGASGSGGGVLVDADANFSATDSFITGNRSNRAGGGIEVVAGTGTSSLNNTALNSNNAGASPAVAAPGNGGGLHISGAQDLAITGGTVNGNTAAREGGGLWNGTGVMTVDGVLIDANTALGAAANQGGAGIFNNGGTLNVVNGTTVSNNLSTGASASGGGLLSTTGAVTVSNSTFDSNSANRAGGAIELIDGTLDFSNSVMSNNDVNGTAGTPAPGNGGGFHVTGMSGTVNITTSSIFGNEAANDGGGLWNQNGTTMTVINSVLYGNSAGEGGAIYNNTGSITTVMTSTISGNTATVSGGGLSNNGASLSLNAVTVAQNNAATGGGIDAVNSVSLKNTIVALNTAGSGADVSGTITSNDYNLVGSDDLNVFTPQANDLEGVNPLVGPLQDNGGTTLTHQLLDGSPAFDAGAPGDNFDDQIGQPVFGATRDIGAYESQVVLSITEFNEVSVVKIYPNPTKGQFNIVIGDNVAGAIEVQIVSITGKLVQKLNIGNGVNNMNISGLSTGMYIVKINTERGSTSHRLILD